MKNIKCYLSNFIKKGLLFILSIFMVLSSVSYRGFTEERYEGGYGGRWTGPVLLADGTLNIDTSVGWYLGGTSHGQEGVMSINGKTVFCLERQKTYYDGMSYVEAGASFESLGISVDQAFRFSLISYYAEQRAKMNIDWISVAQSLIWAEQGEGRGYVLSPSFPDYASLQVAMNTLSKDVDDYYIKPSFDSSMQNIKVGETIRLTDTNGVLGTYEIYDTDGLEAYIDGNDLVVTGTSEANDASAIQLEKIIDSASTKTSILYDAGPDTQKIGAFYISDPIGSYLDFTVEKYGSLEITKVDDRGNPVAGATFVLSYDTGMVDLIGRIETDKSGIITVGDLLPKRVYITEISAPDNLIKDDTQYTSDIVPNHTNKLTVTNNWKQGYIEVTKKDKDTNKAIQIAGTIFEIYNASNNLVATITTDSTGVAKSNLLDYGQYTIKEREAPVGYTVKLENDSIAILSDGSTESTSIYNTRVKGTVTLNKTDSETGKTQQGEATLKDAVYGLYARNNILDPSNDSTILYNAGVKVADLTTDNDGNASKNDLYLGDYYFKEIKAPTGMQLDPTEYDFSLTYANQNTAIVTSNIEVKEDVIKGKLEVTKLGSDGSSGVINGLPGVEFTIKLQNDVNEVGWDLAKTYDILTTNDLGKDVSVDLPYGLYIVRETKTPTDFAPSSDFLVDIKTHNKIEYRVVNNAPFKAHLRLQKIDVDGNPITLSKATFKIKDIDGNFIQQKVGGKYINEFTTDLNGICQLPLMLSPGRYTIVEISAPNSFLLGSEIEVDISSLNPDVEFDVDNQPVIPVKIINEKPTANIILHKVFENEIDNGLGGAIFRLTANQNIINPTDGSVIYEVGDVINIDGAEDGLYTIAESGELRINGLPMGTFGASYKLEEVATLDGYVLLEEPIVFDFEIADNTTKEYVIKKEVENKLTETYFSKTDAAGEELPGASMKLVDEHGNIIDEWVSTETKHVIKGLIYGKEYTLIEDLAPLGFILANEITFIYSKDIVIVTMIDKLLGVNKIDADGNPVSGATLQILDTNSNIVDEWITDGTIYYPSGLSEGESYVLREAKAPKNYTLAQDIQFTVSIDKENQIITMVNKQVVVRKIDANTNNALPGAKLAIIDKETNEVVDEWVTTDEDYIVENVMSGKTYLLRELEAPKGYLTSVDIEFTVNGESDQFVVMKDIPKIGEVDYITSDRNTSGNTNFKLNVDTGDATMITCAFALLLISMVGLLFASKKRRNDNEE